MMLVTGGNGHLGYNLVKILSDNGYKIRTTVRNKEDKSKISHLKVLENVEVIEAELLDYRSLERAMEDIKIVFHTAAPNLMWSANPIDDIINPIVEGTKNVFDVAQRFNVEKIIFTSSCSACGMNSSLDAPLNESHWNNDSTHPILQSKIIAEKFAWNFSKEYRLNCISILPTLIIGPRFYRHTPSTSIYEKILLGKFRFPPEGGCHIVDVRDVAQAHLEAALNPQAQGRYIVAGEFFKFSALIKFLLKIEQGLKISPFQIPLWAIKGLQLTDWAINKMTGRPRELTAEIIKDFLCKFQYVSTKRAEKDLKWNPRTSQQTIIDTFEWIRNTWVK